MISDDVPSKPAGVDPVRLHGSTRPPEPSEWYGNPSDDFRPLFNHMPDGCLRLDAAGRIRDANGAALRMLSFTWRELEGRRLLALLVPETRRQLIADFAAIAGGASIEATDVEFVRRDGTRVLARASAVPLRNGFGEPDGALVLVRDQSDRANFQRQLGAAERLALTGQLAAGIAHEIKNPLQAVLTHLSILDDELGPDFSERLSLDRIGEGIRRIQQIVGDLLDLHRGAEHDVEDVDVNRVAQEAMGLVERSIRQSNIVGRLDLAAGLPAARALGRHVYQVLLNLLLNAIDAMPRGGTLTLKTRYVPAARQIEIEVADSGEGIAEELLAHIFDPFRTVHRMRGTGLGLFVTLGLVRQHGGHIDVDSRPGRGASFRVYFPAHEPESPDHEPGPAARERPRPEAS